MKVSVSALDDDGAIALDGPLNPEVRSTITEVRSHGITVGIVSGRILEELRQMTGGLGFVDAVVAENGAVLAFSSGNSKLIGHPISHHSAVVTLPKHLFPARIYQLFCRKFQSPLAAIRIPYTDRKGAEEGYVVLACLRRINAVRRWHAEQDVARNCKQRQRECPLWGILWHTAGI